MNGWIAGANQAQEQLKTMYPEIFKSALYNKTYTPYIKAMQDGLRIFVINAKGLKDDIDNKIDVTKQFEQLRKTLRIVEDMYAFLKEDTSSISQKATAIWVAYDYYDRNKEMFTHEYLGA